LSSKANLAKHRSLCAKNSESGENGENGENGKND
jgi:hypothetical protein